MTLSGAVARSSPATLVRTVELVEALPRSGTGKIQWRTLQEREWNGESRD